MKFGVCILGNQPVSTIVRQVQLAESLGYDTAWIADSQLVCRELYVTMTACVLNTSRIRIGSGVTVAYTRHPSVTASAFVSLNELAEGRIVLGVGTGDSALGTLGLSMEKMARIATIEHVVSTVRALMRNETVRFESGTEGKIAWLTRPHEIPIIVGASGPRMLQAAGRLGDGVFLHACTSRKLVEAALPYVRAGADSAGRRLADLDIVILAPTSVSRDRRLARDHVRGRVASHLRHPLPLRLSDEDMAVVQKIRQQYNFLEHATAASRHSSMVPDRLIDLLALAGAPEEVAEKVKDMMQVREIGQIAILPQVPEEGFIAREEMLRMFAEEVMASVA